MLPKLFTFGDFFLPTYGLLVALGFLAGLWVTVRLARRATLPVEAITNLVIYCALAGLAGAKLFMFLFDWKVFWNNPREIFTFSTLRAAGVYQGGLLLAILVAVIYVRRNGLPLLPTCDVFSPGIALAHAIGRMGCLAAGCCWGRETSMPWGITFRNPNAYQMSGTPLLVPLHPTQLYEAAGNLIIFGLLYWRIAKAHVAGEVFAYYLLLYSTARFVIEFYREHEQGTYAGLSLTQWISVVTFMAGGWLLLKTRGRRAPVLAAGSVR
jgi:phosphatidylglycerol---prolipoprotein diacylglyceryl transferase